MKDKFIVINKLESYDGRNGVFSYSTAGKRKTGYLIYDDKDRSVGIVFMSDDERPKYQHRYGQSEILFFDEFEKDFGTWRIIKINRQYLPYKRLKEILTENERYELLMDKSTRKRK